MYIANKSRVSSPPLLSIYMGLLQIDDFYRQLVTVFFFLQKK
nr:MAG TPA: hypothetical protein [Caudoviricetes sp.]